MPAATSTLATPTPTQAPTDLPLTGEQRGPTGPTEVASVVRVVDGDTIVVSIGGRDERLRYIGVDTPETVDPNSPVGWMGPEATAANRELVERREVVLEKDVSEVDRFDRLLRYVWLREPTGWLLVNAELLRRGYAQVVTYPPDVKYVELYLDAQAEARDAGRGLWGAAPPAAPPLAQPSASRAPFVGEQPGACDPSYPTVCIPPSPPDLDCPDITERRFDVLPPDPHRFDGDHDGMGCERD
jgi:micrococcal nuclease